MVGTSRTAEVRILGPASSKMNKGPDLSLLRPPILTSLTGMKQAIHALETGTLEVKRTLLNESNLIYECRVCLSMFRSLANLVAHKRTFCKHQYAGVRHRFQGQEDKENCTEVLVVPEDTDCASEVDTWNLENYSPSMDLIKSAGIIKDILAAPLVSKLKPDRSIGAVTNRLNALASKDPSSLFRTPRTEAKPPVEQILLEPMFNTSNALFQSWRVSGAGKESIKDIHRELNFSRFVDKHIVVMEQEETTATAPVGGMDSTNPQPSKPTEETGEELRYPCLYCHLHYKGWDSVKRHLRDIHNKDPEFINSKKEAVFKKAFYSRIEQCQYPESKSAPSSSSSSSAPGSSSSKGRFINPVKSVQVDLKKVLPDKATSICKWIGNEETCPVLQAHTVFDVLHPVLTRPEMKADQTDHLPKDVEKKIMESINRRRLQCTECYKWFRSTHLARQHVASAHLRLGRFTCSVCNHAAWTEEHVVKHAERAHRRSNRSIVVEHPVEVYFAKYRQEESAMLRVDQLVPNLAASSTNPKLRADSPKLAAGSTNPNMFECTPDCGNSKVVNGLNHEADMVPVSLIVGLQKEMGRQDEQNRQSEDGVSFNENRRLSKRRRCSSEGREMKEPPPTKLSRDLLSKKALESPPTLLSKMMMTRPYIWPATERSPRSQEKLVEKVHLPQNTKEKEADLIQNKTGRNTRKRAGHGKPEH